MTTATDEIRLNIGAGDTVIEGFTPIDRKLGSEAFPLPQYADNSVAEIRASHILEHFSFKEVLEALQEWHRVLKPGGRLRVAVPDARKILAGDDPMWAYHLMGGQTDANDFHKSIYDEARLSAYLRRHGFVNVQRWESPNTDTAAHEYSLNLEGFKPEPGQPEGTAIKIKAVMSLPRIGWNDAWTCISETLRPFRIPVTTFNGVFWGQCMQRAFSECVAEGVDWILALDYDSMITPQHLDTLLYWFGVRPDIDALAPLQMRRGHDYPLFMPGDQTQLRDVRPGVKELEVTGEPIKVTTAHFGMTLIRAECLKDVPKPWFAAKPDASGDWSDDRMDDDIWFWHQWRAAGKTIWMAPDCRIGHLELMVSEYDGEMQPHHTPIREWRERNYPPRNKPQCS